ncbi:Asx homology domain-containing protein [Lipomyces oligophaga]|uniref:Asx homology domain-containing protein n=1 Tax=Lipomyces oligophaga TaxID=45792 RepID=UPI0034CE0149
MGQNYETDLKLNYSSEQVRRFSRRLSIGRDNVNLTDIRSLNPTKTRKRKIQSLQVDSEHTTKQTVLFGESGHRKCGRKQKCKTSSSTNVRNRSRSIRPKSRLDATIVPTNLRRSSRISCRYKVDCTEHVGHEFEGKVMDLDNHVSVISPEDLAKSELSQPESQSKSIFTDFVGVQSDSDDDLSVYDWNLDPLGLNNLVMKDSDLGGHTAIFQDPQLSVPLEPVTELIHSDMRTYELDNTEQSVTALVTEGRVDRNSARVDLALSAEDISELFEERKTRKSERPELNVEENICSNLETVELDQPVSTFQTISEFASLKPHSAETSAEYSIAHIDSSDSNKLELSVKKIDHLQREDLSVDIEALDKSNQLNYDDEVFNPELEQPEFSGSLIQPCNADQVTERNMNTRRITPTYTKLCSTKELFKSTIQQTSYLEPEDVLPVPIAERNIIAKENEKISIESDLTPVIQLDVKSRNTLIPELGSSLVPDQIPILPSNSIITSIPAAREEPKHRARRTHRIRVPSQKKNLLEASSALANPTAERKSRLGKYSVESLLTSQSSALIDFPDLSNLINAETFAQLSESDQQELLCYLSPVDVITDSPQLQPHEGQPKRSLSPNFFNSTIIKEAARLLQQDLSLGRYTLNYANKLNRARTMKLDDTLASYKDDLFESWWGQRARS